jgi:hypothetical protein
MTGKPVSRQWLKSTKTGTEIGKPFFKKNQFLKKSDSPGSLPKTGETSPDRFLQFFYQFFIP